MQKTTLKSKSCDINNLASQWSNFHSPLSSLDTHELTITKFPFDQEIRNSNLSLMTDPPKVIRSLPEWPDLLQKYWKGTHNCTTTITISTHQLYLPKYPPGLTDKVLI